MTRITNLVLKLKVWKDTRGQDLIEYALMAGFVAVAAGAIMPGVSSSISTIFSKVSSVMSSCRQLNWGHNLLVGRRGDYPLPRLSS